MVGQGVFCSCATSLEGMRQLLVFYMFATVIIYEAAGLS